MEYVMINGGSMNLIQSMANSFQCLTDWDDREDSKDSKIQNSFIASDQTYYDIQHRHISINYKYQK